MSGRRAFLLAVLAVVASGCGRSTMALIGNSNIAKRPGAMRVGFGDYELDVHAHSGAGVRGGTCKLCTWVDWSADLTDARAGTIVINLGVNDTGFPGTPTTQGYTGYDGKIDYLMGLLPSEAKVVWSNLPCELLPPDRTAGCAVINDALSAAPGRWSNLSVADWASVARAEYFAADQIHLSYDGAVAWTAVVLDTID